MLTSSLSPLSASTLGIPTAHHMAAPTLMPICQSGLIEMGSFPHELMLPLLCRTKHTDAALGCQLSSGKVWVWGPAPCPSTPSSSLSWLLLPRRICS